MTCIELVRHVPECEYLYLYMLKNGDRFPYDQSPWAARPYASIEAEIEFAEPYHKELLDLVGSYTQEELSATKILWSSKGYARTIGDFILRVAYHESVHTGQILSYLRMLDVPRPDVWD